MGCSRSSEVEGLGGPLSDPHSLPLHRMDQALKQLAEIRESERHLKSLENQVPGWQGVGAEGPHLGGGGRLRRQERGLSMSGSQGRGCRRQWGEEGWGYKGQREGVK